MLSLDDRALAVFTEAWRLLPPLKRVIDLAGIGLEDLGAQHGSYNPDTHELLLSTRLLDGPAHMLPLIDVNGNDPPQCLPACSRSLHTAIHEAVHALGDATGLDKTLEWLRLSGFVESEDTPQGTARYWERRPGWGNFASPWRYRVGSWFPREYSTKNPAECFADCVTHVALGWQDFFVTPNGLAKLAYIRRHVWEQRGPQTIAAARQRWQRRLGTASPQRPRHGQLSAQTYGDILDEAIATMGEAVQDENEDYKAALLLAWQRGTRTVEEDQQRGYRQALLTAVGPTLYALYRRVWTATATAHDVALTEMPAFSDAQVDAVVKAVTSYVETTQRWLDEAVPVAIRDTMPVSEVQRRVDAVFERSDTVRARQMAETAARRMAEAAKVDAWRAAGEMYGYWRTHSAQPCEFCTALEGQRVRLGEAFVRLHDTIHGASGKIMEVTYEDVYHPTLHPRCQCSVELD